MSDFFFDVITASKLEKVYDDSDTKSEVGISVFQAVLHEIPQGYYAIGQAAVRQTHADDAPVSSVIPVKPSHPDLVKTPESYTLKWNDKGSEGKHNGSFWRVIAPDGYVALGDVVTDNYAEPNIQFSSKFACIKQDVLVRGEFNPKELWSDKGSGAHKSGSVWQVEGPGLAGFFKVQAGYQKPDVRVFALPAKVLHK